MSNNIKNCSLFFSEYLLHLEKKEQAILIQEIEIKVAVPLPLRTGVYNFS